MVTNLAEKLRSLRNGFEAIVQYLVYFKARAIVADEARAIHAATIGAQRAAASEAIETVRWAKGVATDDRAEQAIVEAFTEGVVASTRALQEMLNQVPSTDPTERMAALADPSRGFVSLQSGSGTTEDLTKPSANGVAALPNSSPKL